MVRRAGKTFFTKSDDDNLIIYIAEVKPVESGRQGNKMYIDLEKSGDQRPWAKRHTWQSWRERYRMNQDWFNHQIKKYQKKLKEGPTEEKTEDREELYAELFGISQFSDDGGDESDVNEKSLAPSKPALSTGQEPSPATAITYKSPQHIHAKKVVSRDDDSNFFGTPSPSASPSLPAANSNPRSDPPTLIEGSFRSSFKRPRAAFGNVTNDESWPPKRRRKIAKDGDVNPDVEMSDSYCRVEKNKAVSSSLPTEGSANGQTRPCPPAQVNATASSSKVLLPDPPHRPAKPTNLMKVTYAKAIPSSDTNHVHTDAPTDAPSLPKPIQDTNLNFVNKIHHGCVAGSSSQNPMPIKSVHRLISSPDDNVDLQLERLSSVDIDDPFIANKHTTAFPVEDYILPPRRIDLRKSLDATRRRRSRTSTTSSTSRHSNPSFLLPEDRVIINQVGLRKVMAVIAKNYGFDVDVAMNAFFETKSIEKTKSLLQFAKEVTNSATSALLSELVKDDDIDSSNDNEAHMWRGHNNSSTPNDQRSTSNSGRQKAKRSLGGSRKSNQFSIKPRPFDEEIDEMAFSDYSPPHFSRAGQFSRLVKEGRREEAVERERRRASGAFVAQTQTQDQRYDDEDQQRQLPRMPNSSPTPNYPGQKPTVDIDDACNVDDFQLPIVAPHKEDIVVQHRDQLPDDYIPLPVDADQHHHRVFFKRISEGQSTLNEDEDDPEVLKLAKEHGDLVKNVMEDNADALRSFEQKHNQDLLRLWSLEWVRQKIAEM